MVNLRSAASLSLLSAMALTLLAPGSVAAQAPPFELVPGDDCPISDIVAVDSCLHIRDGKDDLLTADGQSLFGSDASVDVKEVFFATTKLTGKDRKAIDQHRKRAGRNGGSGAEAKYKKGQPAVVAIYHTFEPVQCDGAGNLQSWFAYDGPDATALGPGSWANLQAGTENLVMGGRFGIDDDTSYTSITTDLSGVSPGTAPEWAGSKAFDSVWCDETTGAIVHVSRPPRRAISVGIGLISDHGDVLAQDRVGVPTDTVRIPLSKEDVLPNYSCSSIVLRPPPLAIGDEAAGGPRLIGTMVAPITSADPANEQDELDVLSETLLNSFFVEGATLDELEIDAYSAGKVRWAQATLDGVGVSIDPTPSASKKRRDARLHEIRLELFEAQLRDTGIDIDLQGDLLCGRFELRTDVCDLADADAFATTMGVPREGVTKQSLVSSDASHLCLLRAREESEPFAVLIIETDTFEIGAHFTNPPPPGCLRDFLRSDDEDLHLDCGEGSVKSSVRQLDPAFLERAGGPDSDWLGFDRRLHMTIDRLRGGGVDMDPPAEDIADLFDGVAENLGGSIHIHDGGILDDAGWTLSDEEVCTGC